MHQSRRQIKKEPLESLQTPGERVGDGNLRKHQTTTLGWSSVELSFRVFSSCLLILMIVLPNGRLCALDLEAGALDPCFVFQGAPGLRYTASAMLKDGRLIASGLSAKRPIVHLFHQDGSRDDSFTSVSNLEGTINSILVESAQQRLYLIGSSPLPGRPSFSGF